MLGKRIAALRRERGMSQRQLAEALGVSASAVGMYEQDRREPSAEKLVALSAVLGVSLDRLLTGRPDDPSDEAAMRAWYRSLREELRDAFIRLPDGTTRPLSGAETGALLAALSGDGD